MVKSITVNGVKIEVPASMVENGGKFEISREGADPVVIDLNNNKSTEAMEVLAGALLGVSIGTVINHLTSAGTFTDPKEVVKTQKFESKLEKVKSKLNDKITVASMDEAKKFISDRKSSDYVKAYVKKDQFAIAILQPASLDLKQIAGCKPLTVFTFIKNAKGKVKAVPLVNAYLKKS